MSLISRHNIFDVLEGLNLGVGAIDNMHRNKLFFRLSVIAYGSGFQLR